VNRNKGERKKEDDQEGKKTSKERKRANQGWIFISSSFQKEKSCSFQKHLTKEK